MKTKTNPVLASYTNYAGQSYVPMSYSLFELNPQTGEFSELRHFNVVAGQEYRWKTYQRIENTANSWSQKISYGPYFKQSSNGYIASPWCDESVKFALMHKT